ncbi:MAG: hypothetical protein LBO65_02285 [Spirochaetaceae bacterium]|jgi:hypothetical protein|nr:hypothetical protein [Spirochaetaceae bacterium]
MFNFKIAGIAAGAAFAFSLLIGLISRIGPVVLLFRALLFGALFFGLSCLVFWLLGQFVPELLSEPEDDLDIPSAGSRVDITLGNPMEGAFPTDGTEEVDDIAGRPGFSSSREGMAGAPLDQDGDGMYTEERGAGDNLELGPGGIPGEELPGHFTPSAPPEGLPGMEDFAAVPGSPAKEGDPQALSFDTPEPKRSAPHSGKPALAGDFNPKELARAIQTALKRDERG